MLGEVVACEPPRRIEYTWVPGSIELPTTVEVVFRHEDDATVVEVTHREGDAALGDAWPKRLTIFTNAWDHVLEAFSQAVL